MNEKQQWLEVMLENLREHLQINSIPVEHISVIYG